MYIQCFVTMWFGYLVGQRVCPTLPPSPVFVNHYIAQYARTHSHTLNMPYDPPPHFVVSATHGSISVSYPLALCSGIITSV